MNFKQAQIGMLGAAIMLCPAAAFGQNDAYGSAQPGQGNPTTPSQQGRPQPQPSQQPPELPSMQESSGHGEDNPQMTKDKMFLRKTAEGGIAEVKFGELATQKAASEDVKTFAQKMIDEHTAMSKEMEPIADSMGVKLPTHMDKEDQAEYDKLKGLSGDEFDTEYLTVMVKDHHKDLREFRLESANTQDPTLRNAVVKGQRMIHEHMVTVDSLAKNKGIAVPSHHGNLAVTPPPPQ